MLCCPGGTNDRSQAIYCLETRSIENPSRRARSDPYPGLTNRPSGGAPIGPIIPYPPFTRRIKIVLVLVLEKWGSSGPEFVDQVFGPESVARRIRRTAVKCLSLVGT
jgi:hypothetical protein